MLIESLDKTTPLVYIRTVEEREARTPLAKPSSLSLVVNRKPKLNPTKDE
jgi:hypothetical protein